MVCMLKGKKLSRQDQGDHAAADFGKQINEDQ
jgi:hypothetical protein